MFARGGSNCPVQTLRIFFFRRIDPQDNFFFNNGSKGAISSPQMTDVWYLANPCKQFQFCKFMPHIFKNSGCSRKYTTHCLCSTATQASNNERFEICYIIYWVAIESKLLWDPSTGTVQQHKNSIWVMHLLRSLKRPLRRSHCPVL